MGAYTVNYGNSKGQRMTGMNFLPSESEFVVETECVGTLAANGFAASRLGARTPINIIHVKQPSQHTKVNPGFYVVVDAFSRMSFVLICVRFKEKTMPL